MDRASFPSNSSLTFTVCANRAHGCPAVLPMDAVTDHETACPFSPLRCVHRGSCGYLGRVIDMAGHLVRAHSCPYYHVGVPPSLVAVTRTLIPKLWTGRPFLQIPA
ncbi:uncharacterized protein [Dermacentor andersoni]|uniref:uncharacterized protein n=1 Tax=Dermacentor andersoni TaxID=34620 RepID=UPI00241718DC|nr:E3 ubiquitin-protein ligase PDZRN3-B-like [Dermacentor andersoni]